MWTHKTILLTLLNTILSFSTHHFYHYRNLVLAMYLTTFLAWIAGLQASAILHNSLLSHVLHNPMNFFDVTPSGRILARFSNDVNTVDDRLINSIRQCLMTLLRVRANYCDLEILEISIEKSVEEHFLMIFLLCPLSNFWKTRACFEFSSCASQHCLKLFFVSHRSLASAQENVFNFFHHYELLFFLLQKQQQK